MHFKGCTRSALLTTIVVCVYLTLAHCSAPGDECLAKAVEEDICVRNPSGMKAKGTLETLMNALTSQPAKRHSAPLLRLEKKKRSFTGDVCGPPYVRAKLPLPGSVFMCVYNSRQDRYISSSIAGGHYWDDFVMGHMLRELEGKPQGIVLDAGANIGQFSIAAASFGHVVYSFEPMTENVDLMLRSVYINPGFEERVHIFQVGLSDEEGTGELLTPESNRGGGNMRRLLSENLLKEDNVHIIRLDSILHLLRQRHPGLPIHFFKADVEGYEPRMLKGASGLFRAYNISTLALEIQRTEWDWQGCPASKVMKAFENCGYNIVTSMTGKKNMKADAVAAKAGTFRTLDTVLFKSPIY